MRFTYRESIAYRVFMKFLFKFLRLSVIWLFTGFTVGVVLLAGAYIYLAPGLPSTDVLKDVQLQTPLRVLSRDGALVAEFGEKKRSPLKYKDAPDLLMKAVLAAEDNRFFEHPGVDYQGILRAAMHLVKTGRKGQGGSTITMQVARNFFLSREKTYLRKISEIFLALKIEREISKEEILELYLNKIYLGHRSYGVSAAARVYYGKDIRDLRVDQLAMIAGLPKAPSTNNPITNKKRAMIRRNYVLGRMFDLDYIDKATYEQATAVVDEAVWHGLSIELEAPYVAEMVRAEMVTRYGPEAYTQGYRVYTTIDTRLQRYANNALRKGLLDYEYRHGYRGRESKMTLEPALLEVLPVSEAPSLNRPVSEEVAPVIIESLPEALTRHVRERLSEIPVVGKLQPAVVIHTEDRAITVLQRNGELHRIDWQGLKWARPYIDENTRGPKPKYANDILQQGDIIRIHKQDDNKFKLSQLPTAKGSLVTLAPNDAAIKALVGGFDFYYSKFNRVTQARRQPGSNFKPFIYSAALDNGFTAASLINDAPVVFDDPSLENTWRPENYSGKFFGPTRLRVGLMKSRNLISIRLLRAIGIRKVVNYAKQFGFDESRLPKDLSLALGSAAITPLELVSGYASIANGGYKVSPYFIDRIEDDEGNVVFQNNPLQVCRECEKQIELELQQALMKEEALVEEKTLPSESTKEEEISSEETQVPINVAQRIMTEQNNYIMNSILADVIRSGTARRALRIGRKDLAGKTGTTNDQKDAWFSGYSGTLVTTVWVGFDNNNPLGSRETGSSAALPMWIYFMENAMKGVPEKDVVVPQDLVTVKIDPDTGLLASQNQKNAIFEIFRTDNVPKQTARTISTTEQDRQISVEQAPEQIF